MANWQLTDIINKVRATTGRPDISMMSDSTVVSYINNYYQYVLPKELKIFWGYTYYQFFTQPNVDQYIAPTNFQTLNPQITFDGWPGCWYLSPDLFYQDYPQQENKVVVGTGDGVTTTFSFVIPAFPVLAGSVYVTDGVQVAQDDGTGGFLAPYSGSINYITGAVSVSFVVAPSTNANITVASQTYMANRPQGILFFKSQPLSDSTVAVRDADKMFVLRPVPDQVYLVKMQGIQIPPSFDLSHIDSNGVYTDVPFRTDLGPLIAYGASLEIFADFNQMDQYDQTIVQYNRYKDISMQDTYEEYLYERSVPRF